MYIVIRSFTNCIKILLVVLLSKIRFREAAKKVLFLVARTKRTFVKL